MQMTFLHTQAHSFRSVHFAHSARRVIYASTSGDAFNPSSILFVAKNFHLAQKFNSHWLRYDANVVGLFLLIAP